MYRNFDKNRLWAPLVAIFICEAVGGIGALFTTPAIPTWYAGLLKPVLRPPNWLFGPVWTVLFLMMGVAAYLVWQRRQKRRAARVALVLFAVQLAFNAAWSAIFFGLRNPGAAFVELAALWLLILATIVAFRPLSKPAAWLLVPYLLWVSFAGYLNYSIWILNKEPPASGPLACTQEAKLCPDGSYVARTGPNCEFAPCPPPAAAPARDASGLPRGYSLDSYTIEKTLDGSPCVTDGDCVTPGEYMAVSRCPMRTLCLDNACTVVCPSFVGR